jgi:kynurenine 3-monooxygenase
LVTFNEHIGYNEAMKRGRAQDEVLLNMLSDNTVNTHLEITTEELKVILNKVKIETSIILEEDKIADTFSKH